MTRPFRLEVDERRYFALRSELYIRLARSGLPAQVVHDILRNFGRCEDMLFFEGVRQGMAAALLADPERGHLRQPALAVHSDLYGIAATPLVRVEDVAVHAARDTSGTRDPYPEHPWLAKEPLKFAPLTITEAIEMYGEDLAVRVPVPVASDQPAATKKRSLEDDFDPMEALNALANGGSTEDILGIKDPAIFDSGGGDSEGTDEPVHRPELLDRIRDALVKMPQAASWKELILGLMREMRMDASVLDDVLSTPMGMTVISQAGLLHLHPGSLDGVKMLESHNGSPEGT